MKEVPSYFLARLAWVGSPARGETVIAGVLARPVTSLNGHWRVIVDPYDEAAKISGGFALDRQPNDKTEFLNQ